MSRKYLFIIYLLKPFGKKFKPVLYTRSQHQRAFLLYFPSHEKIFQSQGKKSHGIFSSPKNFIKFIMNPEQKIPKIPSQSHLCSALKENENFQPKFCNLPTADLSDKSVLMTKIIIDFYSV